MNRHEMMKLVFLPATAGEDRTYGAIPERLADDPDTKIIGMYLEGIKDGRRFRDAVKRVSLKKPILIWKGGLTEAGARAARSHTASLAGEKQIWEAFFKMA